MALLTEKKNILRHCADCPATTLDGSGQAIRSADDDVSTTTSSSKHSSSSKSASSAASNGTSSSFSIADQIELNYRDGILELEERVMQAQLGSLRVKDRAAWRDAIVNRGFDRRSAKGLSWSGKEEMSEAELNELSEGVIADMAKATLQIRQAVDDKYLNPPLGAPEEKETKKSEKEKKKKRKKDDSDDEEEEEEEEEDEEVPTKSVSDAWEESLMRVKNFSQLYVHLSTLENSIAWQKSALNAMCKICRRKGDPEKVGFFSSSRFDCHLTCHSNSLFSAVYCHLICRSNCSFSAVSSVYSCVKGPPNPICYWRIFAIANIGIKKKWLEGT